MGLNELLNKIKELSDKITELEKTVENLKDENKEMSDIIKTYNKNYLQRTKVMNGQKIALKTDIKEEDIQKLLKDGLSYREIADKLNCSRSTVWRRVHK